MLKRYLPEYMQMPGPTHLFSTTSYTVFPIDGLMTEQIRDKWSPLRHPPCPARGVLLGHLNNETSRFAPDVYGVQNAQCRATASSRRRDLHGRVEALSTPRQPGDAKSRDYYTAQTCGKPNHNDYFKLFDYPTGLRMTTTPTILLRSWFQPEMYVP